MYKEIDSSYTRRGSGGYHCKRLNIQAVKMGAGRPLACIIEVETRNPTSVLNT